MFTLGFFFFLFFFYSLIYSLSADHQKAAVGKLEIEKRTKKKFGIKGVNEEGKDVIEEREQWNLNAEKNKPQLDEMGNRAKRNDLDGYTKRGQTYSWAFMRSSPVVVFVVDLFQQRAALPWQRERRRAQAKAG